MVIDLFVKLIEGLTKVMEHLRNDRRQLFSEIVDPMYQQLQPVIDDYYSSFYEARDSVKAAKTPEALAAAIESIRERRERTLLARLTIRGLIEEMQSRIKDDHVRHFARQVLRFFYCTEISLGHRSSVMNSFVELCDYVQKNDLDKALLVEYVGEALQSMVDASSAIASTYSAVRLHCLCPPRFLVKVDKRAGLVDSLE